MIKNETEKELKKICLSAKCEAGYIFSVKNKNAAIVSCYGNIGKNDKTLTAINNIVVRKKGFSISEIKKTKEFRKLREEKGFKYFFKKLLTADSAKEYFLALLARENAIYSKIDTKKIESLVKAKKTNIKKPAAAASASFNSGMVMNTDAPVLLSTAGLDTVLANDSLAAILNAENGAISKEFFYNADFFDFQNKRLRVDDLPFVIAAKEKSNITDFKLRYSDRTKNEKWFKINSFQTELSDGTKAVLSLFCDVTRQYGMDQSLKETFASIQSVLYSTNNKGDEYNFITDAVRNLFGYSPEDVYKNKFRILRSIYPGDLITFKNFLSKIQSGEPSTIEYIMKDRFGKEHWVRHSGVPIFKNNDVIRIVGEIQDITEEKKVSLNLERSEERFRALVDTADDLIFILDGFGYISIINKNGASALGFTPDEMIGKHFLEFVAKDEASKIADAFAKILNSSDVTTFETVFIDRFEKEITFEINAKPMVTDGEISGMLSIGRNISNRKADEQKIKDLNSKLIEANRIISIERERARHKITVLEELNKLKSEFISNVSHELRTPLASIVGFAETILSDRDLPEDTIHEFVDIILTEGKRLAKLINDLLDFSKLESGDEELNRTHINLVDILKLVLQTFQKQINEKEIIVSKEFPEDEIIINADKERLVKVFSNLLSNAVKFTGAGGRINLIVQDFGKEVEIAVSDTGAGISEKELPYLFQKFSKVQKPGQPIGGTGFGLVTVKQIIDLHKGFIRVKSELNKGTTFIIRVPK